jgi:hypothetical protein
MPAETQRDAQGFGAIISPFARAPGDEAVAPGQFRIGPALQFATSASRAD